MKFFYSLFLLIIVLTVSCSKDDNIDSNTKSLNDSITYFTLKVNKFYIDETKNSGYLIINDNEGNILAHTKIENDKEYNFRAKKGEEKESFTVSRFSQMNRESSQFNFLNSYFNIKKGAFWNFEGFDYQSNTDPEVLRTCSLKFRNIGVYSDVILSSNGGFSSSSSGYSDGIDYNIKFYKSHIKFLITVHYMFEKSKYVLVNNVQDQQEIFIDGSELKEFDSYIPIDLPNDGNSYSKLLSANLKPGERFRTTRNTSIENELSSSFGVLKNFYDFNITISTFNTAENYSYRYKRNSPTLEAITIPSYSTDFKLINSSKNDFEYSANYKHSTKQSSWTYSAQNSVNPNYSYHNWIFQSNELPYQTIPKLPREFLDLYANFDIKNLKYSGTSFSKGPVYEDIFKGTNVSINNRTIVTETLSFSNPDNTNRSFKDDEKFEEIIEEFYNYHN